MLWLSLLACHQLAPSSPLKSTIPVHMPSEVGDARTLVAMADASDAATFTWSADGVVVGSGRVLAAEHVVAGTTLTLDVVEGDAAGSATLTVVPTEPVKGGYGFRRLADLGPGSRPSDLLALPDGRLLVSGLGGTLWLVDPDEGAVAELELGASMDTVAIALHPAFGDGAHDWLFVWHNLSTELVRVDLSLEPFEATDPEVLFTGTPEGTDGHAGGDLLFWSGETGTPVLYLSAGSGDPEQAQDDSSNLGKLLAFTVGEDGTLAPGVDAGYANPYVAAIGLRNPWRLADCGTVLCIADAGSTTWESLEVYTGGPQNFGWPDADGFGTGLDPYWGYHRDDAAWVIEDADNSRGRPREMRVIGMGTAPSDQVLSGALAGTVLVADFYDGWIRAVTIGAEGGLPETQQIAHLRYVTGMAEVSGRLFVAEMSGTVRELVPRAEMDMAGVPGDLLSASGYAAGGIAFTPQWPLWGNGADKARMVQIPEGGVIDTTDSDDWVYPVGTQAWSDYSTDGVSREVHVLTLTERGWLTGVYVIGEDGEGRLSDGYATRTPVGDLPVPSVPECEECHGARRDHGYVLGVNPFQLGDAQLAEFAPWLDRPPAPAPVLTGDPVTVEARGRLYGECAYCHRTDALAADVAFVALDLAWFTPEDQLGAIDVPAMYHTHHDEEGHEETDHGTSHDETGHDEEALILVPGDPEASILAHVIEDLEMPPMALEKQNTALLDAVTAWIEAMEP